MKSKCTLNTTFKLSEMLENANQKYQNKLLTAVKIIKGVIEIAKEFCEAEKCGVKLKSLNDEVAFYDV